MTTIRSLRARRRRLLGVPALVAAAVALVSRPAHAAQAPAPEPECAADLVAGA
ncbi:hypothetical protein [Catellatospora vulcania]|uniref:hypothetical protein n=1 Tax=Catellatospora vulcania TaxID=1460450 RepID=UPI0018AFE6B0|nr:hypothetical protein [Catellatospora vulcania]